MVMTVGEYIEALEKFDKDRPVILYDDTGCFGPYDDPEDDTDENGKKYVILG